MGILYSVYTLYLRLRDLQIACWVKPYTCCELCGKKFKFKYHDELFKVIREVWLRIIENTLDKNVYYHPPHEALKLTE